MDSEKDINNNQIYFYFEHIIKKINFVPINSKISYNVNGKL